ncbi:low affinity iron permease family protein [Mesorhizobium sp. NBSH29]|uniref:low affinity iron permease family protein n=1 Tax=Mesorhizobium sp. NBSH29 TaxID=2654249 RepID=UPI001896A14B|nr:low affinity iron permease family protein [Mesorhizobium sp. NBSH29]QPC88183.1 low affinity iron permease family protein [Mesorhizobium sp. NBSH29]
MFEKFFTSVANKVSRATGRPMAFIVCVVIIVIWAISGPVFGFSDTWQLIINTGTTIITFLMVFLIQNTQNRDGAAIQTKVDELLRVSRGDNLFIGIEHLTESEVETFRAKCETAAQDADARKEGRAKTAKTGKANGRKIAPKRKTAVKRKTAAKA